MKQVRIKNYQSIKDSELNLHPGINVLIGPSDSGKSSVIRAIRDLCFNAPGTGFIRAGQKKTTVEVDHVQWEKGRKVNRYTLVDGTVFDKVGRTSPDEVKDQTGIREVAFGDGVIRRIQIASQLEPHFILGDSPSDNAKVIGRLADLHVIYNALREVDRLRRENTRTLKEHQDRVTMLSQDVESLGEQLGDRQAALEQATVQESTFQGRLKTLSDLTELREALDSLSDARDRHQEAINTMGSPVDLPKLQALCGGFQDLLKARDRIRALKARVLDYEQAHTDHDVDGFQKKAQALLDLKSHKRIVDAKISSMARAEGNLASAEGDLAEVQAKLKEVKTCPMCGGKIDLT